jgi:hypothetical protein
MRSLLAALTLLILIFITPGTLTKSSLRPFESCSCAADDGSCSVTGNCPRGCLAYCPSNNCRFTCVGGGYEELLDMSAPITIQIKDADSNKVATELTRVTGAQVTFNPHRPDATFNLAVKDEPLWNVLDTLSSQGSIQIAKEDFRHLKSVRQAFLSGERMAVCFHNVTAKRLATDLSFLTGRDVYVASGDPKALVDYSVKAVTFDEIVAGASQAAGVQMAVR